MLAFFQVCHKPKKLSKTLHADSYDAPPQMRRNLIKTTYDYQQFQAEANDRPYMNAGTEDALI